MKNTPQKVKYDQIFDNLYIELNQPIHELPEIR